MQQEGLRFFLVSEGRGKFDLHPTIDRLHIWRSVSVSPIASGTRYPLPCALVLVSFRTGTLTQLSLAQSDTFLRTTQLHRSLTEREMT